MPLTDGYYSLGADTNKVRDTGSSEGITNLLPELTLDMSDEDLLNLKRDWMKQWAPYESELKKVWDDCENYWLGKQYSLSEGVRPLVDNLIFESLETFLPIATRPKAEPLVEADNTDIGNQLSDKVRKMLAFLADNLSYNLKLKQVARFWALYMLGALKVGWSEKNSDITCVAIRPQKLILDPNATIEECEYTGYYVGEQVQDMASDLITRFPSKKDEIMKKVQEKTGTQVSYVMWTTDDYVFWTMDDEVLGKAKNPHWNYDTQQAAPVDQYGQQPLDAQGQPAMQTAPGKNHFRSRKKPYIFLSIFNIGNRPHDNTNLIQQNLPLQDLVNKRLTQIDKNADNANNGLIVSGDAFTEEQATNMGKSLRKGGIVWVPTGDVNSAVKRDTGTALPDFVYTSLVDYRNEIRNIFGTRGSTPQGTMSEQTLGGKKIISGQDTDRIGGGVSTYLEQFSDAFFNWCVQLMYVYYDETHYASVLGEERAKEYIGLSNQDFAVRLTVGVKDGSMIPHDPVNQREEAVALWKDGGIDPITFFDRLEFPNPRESAKNLYLWKADPIQLFPDLAAQAAQSAAPQQHPPTEAINFKDVPPEAQTQMLAQAGIIIHPAVMAQHQADQQAQKQQDLQAKLAAKPPQGL